MEKAKTVAMLDDMKKCQCCGCNTRHTTVIKSVSHVVMEACQRCKEALMLVGWIPEE